MTTNFITTGKTYDYEGEIYRIDSERDGVKISEEERSISLVVPEMGYASESITVYKPQHKYGEKLPAEVNWSAFGSVDVAKTLAFAKALAIAVELANELNKQLEV